VSVLRRRPRLATVGLLVVSLAVGLALAEAGLRVAGYRYSPIVFVQPEVEHDHRPLHRGALDPVHPEGHLTVPDSYLLWRPNPAVSAELTPEGFRGEPVPASRPPEHLLVLALGDSNTLGPLNTADHWPGVLQDLLRMNTTRRPVQVVNAGVYGYTSFQGLRRFRQVRGLRPAIAYFSFGGNDAQPVRTPDERYASRIGAVRGWDRLRLAPPLFHLAWRAADAVFGAASVPRVPLPDYRRNLETFIEEALGAGILPVLLTRPYVGHSDDPGFWQYHAPAYNEVVREVSRVRGVPFLDAHAELAAHPDWFSDPMHANRLGHRRLAEALFAQLHGYGLADTGALRDLASALDLATADERRLELGAGFWLRERRPGGRGGRWTDGDATVWLEAPRGERWLLVDLTTQAPRGETRGHIEVNGRPAATLPRTNGRHRLWIDLGRPDTRLEVRVLVESAQRPSDLNPADSDQRLLGVFLHEVRLVGTPVSDVLDLGVAEDGHPALGSGFWAQEQWPDGPGRWTKPAAAWRLTLPGQAEWLWLDVRFHNPQGRTRGTVSIDGQPVGRFDHANSRHLLPFPCPGAAGATVEVRLEVDTPFRPETGDHRTLGVVLHGAWVEGRDGAVRLPRPAGERWLEVDFATEAPLTSGRFEVNGEMVHAFRRGRGRERVALDVSRFGARVLTVRGRVDFPRAAPGVPSALVVYELALRR
jgi:lysophospholipase L1-like esterase